MAEPPNYEFTVTYCCSNCEHSDKIEGECVDGCKNVCLKYDKKLWGGTDSFICDDFEFFGE